jgi:tetratricopeptide (TPR) repeat protein
MAKARWLKAGWTRIAAVVVLGGVAAYGISWGVCAVRLRRDLTRAEAQLQRGFPAAAAETLDRHRAWLTDTDRGCRALIGSYYGARRAERLEWASEACLDGGRDLIEAHLGLAAARELTGRDPDALRLLSQVAPRFDQSPDLYYRMAQIYRRNKRDDAAVGAFLEASKRAPDNAQLSMDALEYFSSINRWAEATRMAEKLRSTPTDNPEIKLLIARALQRGGNRQASELVVAQARELMGKSPELKAALERAYADVLQAADAPAPAEAPPAPVAAPPPTR